MIKFKIFLITILTFVGLFAWNYPIPLLAQQGEINIQITPSKADLKVNEIKIIKVSLTGTSSISGFDLYFKTAGGLLVTDVYDQLVSSNQAIRNTTRKVAEQIDSGGLRVSYVFLDNNNLPENIDLYFKIKGSNLGEGTLTLDQSASQILTSNGDISKLQKSGSSYKIISENSSNNFILADGLPAEIIPTASAVVSLKLRLLGINTYPGGPFKNLNGIVVAVGRVGDSALESQPVAITLVSDKKGIFSAKAIIPDFKDGNKFSLMVKVDKYLLRRICDTKPAEEKAGKYICINPSLTIKQGINSFDFSSIGLVPGDLGLPDGFLNGYDLGIVRNHLGKNNSEALKLSDLNLDGVVDKTDFDIISYSALNSSGENDK